MTGTFANETVFIGDKGGSSATNQSFLLGQSCKIPTSESGGILGLGLNSTIQKVALVQSLNAQSIIPAPIFSLYLDDESFQGTFIPKLGSNLLIGSFDLKTYAEDPSTGFSYHSVVPQASQ